MTGWRNLESDSHPTDRLFTPKTLVEVPSRKNTALNNDGTKLLHKEAESRVDAPKFKGRKVMDIAAGESTRAPVDKNAYEALWLPEEPNIIITLVPCIDHLGNTHVMVYDIQKPESKWYAARYDTYMHHIGTRKTINLLGTLADGRWLLLVYEMKFAPNGKVLYVTAEEHARVSLYKIDLQLRAKPEMLFRGGYVDSIHPLGKDGQQLLITSSNFVDKSLYSIVNTDESHESRVLSSVTDHGARLGISLSQFSEIYFKGSGDHHVHA
ncbi:hypothetical protein K445DRAFT_24108 [Daldinia sp. EC12]|nr:hypothetical protein K445DRAFT_24108 [Daldinia sp. EC12]